MMRLPPRTEAEMRIMLRFCWKKERNLGRRSCLRWRSQALAEWEMFCILELLDIKGFETL